MDKSVGHVMTDFEGNLWFTSTRQCVMKIVPNRFLDLFEYCALPGDMVNATCMLEGRLYIGTDDSGLVVLEDGRKLERLPVTRAATASGEALEVADLLDYLKDERIRCVARDSRGRLWICTWRHQHGLLRYDRGELLAFTTADGMLSNQVRTVSECEDGTILAAQLDGVSVMRGDRVVAGYGAQDGIAITSILTLTEGFNHERIFGSDGGGIYVAGPEGLRHIGLEDGLKSEIILRVKKSRFQDIYWIATGNSIAWMTSDYQVTTVDRFPFSNNYDFYESASGDLWVLSSNGVYVVPSAKMLQNGPISAAFYGISSGLPYIATSNSFSELTEEGDLYIAGVEGAIRVNIDRRFNHTGMVKIALPYVDIDGKRSFPDDTGHFFLPRGASRVTIYPYVFTNSLMEILVPYRLEGFDASEVTVSRDALGPVTYTNLRAGTYRFFVRAFDSAGRSFASTSCQIVREKALSEGGYGTIVMDLASLLLLGGILVYTSPFRKRGQINDRLLFAMIVVNIALAAAEMGGYLLEKTAVPFARALMLADRTAFYVLLELFPCLLALYADYASHRQSDRFRRTSLRCGVPLLLFLALLLVNLKTGWLFSVTRDSAFQPGPIQWAASVPLLLYFAAALVRAAGIDRRLAVIGVLLIGGRILWDLWYIGISSISFVYALFLVGINLFVLGRTLTRRAAR